MKRTKKLVSSLWTSFMDLCVTRCPKTGRVRGLRWDSSLSRLLFPLIGLAAIAWFLVRVIPKPNRATYPCQRFAAGIGGGFLTYLIGLGVSWSLLHRLRRHMTRPLTLAVATVCVAMGCMLALSTGAFSRGYPTEPVVQDFQPQEGPNKPMGQGQGIFPGRVVWAQDFDATRWDGQTGHWWEDQNIDQACVDRMFSESLWKLTGAQSDAEAWDKLFHSFNKTHGRGDRGYQAGERIAIKVNMNPDEKPGGWTNAGFPSPHMAYTMVRGLIEVAGVPGKCITITDSSRPIKDTLLSKIRANPGPDFQQVMVADRDGGPEPYRVKSEPDMNCPIHFDLPGNEKAVMYPPKVYTQAAYLIDYAVVRPHRVFGITMSFKNHFGSVYDPEGKYQGFKPNQLHAFALWDYPTPYKHGQINGLVPLLGHKEIGGKTLIYFAEGLYTAPNQGTTSQVRRWSTLGDRWFSSLLMSQDPVALDSVGLDLISTEVNLTNQPDGRPNPSFNGNQDGYLHEAALADNPPSHAKYDPENDGTVLKSMGVHEHWNNAKDMQYSRNLGKDRGIELVRITH